MSRAASEPIDQSRSPTSVLYVVSFSEASVEHFLSHPPTPENGLVRKELVLVNNGVEHLDR